MEDTEKMELAASYVASAYAAMGRGGEIPPIDFGIGVCLHWSHAGKVLSLSEWIHKMELVEPIPSGLQFIITKDGVSQPLRAPGMKT